MVGIFATRKNIILILMCVELMLLSINLNFVSNYTVEGLVFPQKSDLFIQQIYTVAPVVSISL